MTATNNPRITLELEPGVDPIRGAIVQPDGSRQPFWGWLELSEELRRIAAGPDAHMLNITLAPGGTGGWHSHAGPHITIVKQGTLTIIDAQCKRHQLSAGHAVISPGDATEKDENKGTTPVTFDVTFLIPHGV